jgi:ribose 5-phosphate isomerase B
MKQARLALGADHGGLSLKSDLLTWLHQQKFEVVDVGAYQSDPDDDYPDFAGAVAHIVSACQAEQGIIVCGSGVGACIAANKVPGARACLCHDTYSAHQGVEHDDMNILCLGSRVVGLELAKELVAAFVKATFTGEERHRRRLAKVIAIENRALRSLAEPGKEVAE